MVIINLSWSNSHVALISYPECMASWEDNSNLSLDKTAVSLRTVMNSSSSAVLPCAQNYQENSTAAVDNWEFWLQSQNGKHLWLLWVSDTY